MKTIDSRNSIQDEVKNMSKNSINGRIVIDTDASKIREVLTNPDKIIL